MRRDSQRLLAVAAVAAFLLLSSLGLWLSSSPVLAQQSNFPAGSGGSSLPSYSSGTTTAAITAVTLCSTTNCPAGSYLVMVYANEVGTGCTTVVSGALNVKLNFIDNQAITRSASLVPIVPMFTATYGIAGMNFTTTGTGAGMGTFLVNTNGSAVTGSDSIQILSTVTACGTPGPWTGYQVRAYTLKVG
jgi:hypothetical protein